METLGESNCRPAVWRFSVASVLPMSLFAVSSNKEWARRTLTARQSEFWATIVRIPSFLSLDQLAVSGVTQTPHETTT